MIGFLVLIYILIINAYYLRGGIYLLQKILNKYNNFIKIVTVISFCSMIMFAFIQVVFRYVFNISMMWIGEVSRLLLIYSIFLGSIIAHLYSEHPEINFFIEKIPPGKKIYFKLLKHLIVYFVLICMFYYGIVLYIKLGMIKTSALRFLWKYILLVVPITALSITFNQIKFTCNLFRNNK